MVLVSVVQLDGTVVLKNLELESGQEIQSLRTQVTSEMRCVLLFFKIIFQTIRKYRHVPANVLYIIVC